MAVNARTEEFQHIEVFDKPALFTNGRIARDTVPKGWYCYDIRGSDDDPGELCYMEENVVVNHAGSVLMPEKLAMPKSGRLDVRDELGFLDGHTNITSSRFLVFGVKGMLSAAKNVRNAMLFNVLSFMSDKLLTVGNTVAALDELYIWLSNPTAIEYIRNCLKRVRKKESAMLLASQNLEDFDQEQVREMTKPLFSIPPHQFLFNAGSIDKRSYMEMLQLDEAEYNLIKFPQRGVCLYKCGNERYLLEVHAPAYKEKLFGTAGGR